MGDWKVLSLRAEGMKHSKCPFSADKVTVLWRNLKLYVWSFNTIMKNTNQKSTALSPSPLFENLQPTLAHWVYCFTKVIWNMVGNKLRVGNKLLAYRWTVIQTYDGAQTDWFN